MDKKNICIGIICPSEIALRRFLPSLEKLPQFKFVGVAIANTSEWEGANDDIITTEKNKAQNIVQQFGGKLFDSYNSIINSKEIDALYLPLPPALHFKWAKLALLAGKHVLIEKPATISFNQTKELLNIANDNQLAVHENYMFAYHKQLSAINKIIDRGMIGDIRLYRMAFGFPRRAPNDFRYNKELGGGALLDCGGYTIKYASMLLGETAKIGFANLNKIDDFEVDVYGSGVLYNDNGDTSQISFGMDNAYKCELEVWGSKGTLSTARVFTAPVGFVPEAKITVNNESHSIKLPEDDAFMNSIEVFYNCITNETSRIENYKLIERQAILVDTFINYKNENNAK